MSQDETEMEAQAIADSLAWERFYTNLLNFTAYDPETGYVTLFIREAQ